MDSTFIASASFSSSRLFYPHTSLLTQRIPPHYLRYRSAPSPLWISNSTNKSPTFRTILKSTAGTLILTAATALVVRKFSNSVTRSHPSPMVEESRVPDVVKDEDNDDPSSLVPGFLATNPHHLETLKALLDHNLRTGNDESALQILRSLVRFQPKIRDWKLLLARLLSEMSKFKEARKVFEEILASDPLYSKALFENALLMERCGEGDAVMKRLQEALAIAERKKKKKEARDVRFIMAQMEFLQKNVEGALKIYNDLAMEDRKDCRPYFYKGIVYSLIDMNTEAKVEFARFRSRAPVEFHIEGFLRSGISKMKMFEAVGGKN